MSASLPGSWTDSGYEVYTAGAGYNYEYDNLVIDAGGSQSLDVYRLLFLLSNGGVVSIWEVDGVYYWNEWIGNQWVISAAVGEGGDLTPGSIANWYPQGGWSWGPWTYDDLLVNGAGLQPDQVGGILFAYQGGALVRRDHCLLERADAGKMGGFSP